MVVHHRLIPPLALATLLAASVGCKRDTPEAADAGPPRGGPDHLAEGEIPEGKEKAFTLPLPRAVRVGPRFEGTVHVACQHTPEELANFVRARVRDGKVSTGTAATLFEGVSVATAPDKKLRIEVRRSSPLSGFRSEMTVQDVTPTANDPNLSEADRWKKAGMTPDGKLLDPKHMQ